MRRTAVGSAGACLRWNQKNFSHPYPVRVRRFWPPPPLVIQPINIAPSQGEIGCIAHT